MRRASNLCDYFFICSANSTKQAKAIADGIQEALLEEDVRPWHVEGYRDGNWVILDYSSVVAHIFLKDMRAFYKLERLWGDALRIKFPKLKRAPRPRVKPKKKTVKKKKAAKKASPRCKRTSSKKASPA